jgi:hypothetical protein
VNNWRYHRLRGPSQHDQRHKNNRRYKRDDDGSADQSLRVHVRLAFLGHVSISQTARTEPLAVASFIHLGVGRNRPAVSRNGSPTISQITSQLALVPNPIAIRTKGGKPSGCTKTYRWPRNSNNKPPLSKCSFGACSPSPATALALRIGRHCFTQARATQRRDRTGRAM